MMSKMITIECYHRLRAMLKTEMNPINRIEAINILAIPGMIYGFNIINWSIIEICKLDEKNTKHFDNA